MQNPGFNVECRDGNKARWGFCANCPSQTCGDNGDSDATIGIGLVGQTTGEHSSGWTGYFASGANTCSATSQTHVSVWFYAIPGYTPTDVLVMKVSRNSDAEQLAYDSPLWENSETLNPNSPPEADEHAKYSAFHMQAFKTIKMCMGGPAGHTNSNCVIHELENEYTSARQLFTSGFVSDERIDQEGIIEAFGVTPGSYRVCPMQSPGFNVQCRDNNRARWGFCANCPSQTCGDNGDSDATIGIGLNGQNTGALSAGWTGYFASGANTCSATSETAVSVWFYVQV